VNFASNIDLNEQGEFKDLYRELKVKLCEKLNFNSPSDIMFYLTKNQLIPGINQPQMYIKAPGVWTGGHHESLLFESININHGPGETFWYAVDEKDSSLFENTVIDKCKKFNIYDNPGNWFPDVYFFLTNKIKVQLVVQKCGDIVVTNVGCLHWVRAISYTIHTSWNRALRSFKQLSSSIDNFKQNRENKRRSIVPIHFLILKMYNDHVFDDENRIKNLCYTFITDEIELEDKIEEERAKFKNISYYDELVSEDDIKFCDICECNFFCQYVRVQIKDDEADNYCFSCFNKTKPKSDDIAVIKRNDVYINIKNFKK